MTDPNEVSHVAIQEVDIHDARYAGHGKPLQVRFSPWMSALIGGRGTGKSTVIEMLRLCLRRDGEVPDDLRREFDNFAAVPAGRDRRGALGEQTMAVASFVKDGVRFRVSWRQNGEGPAIEQADDGNQWTPSPGDIADRFPVRILSQKQVFALAGDPDALLRLIDDAPQVNRRSWDAKWNETTARYLRLRSQTRELAAQLADRDRLEGQLADVERQLAVFEEGGHRDLLVRYQRFARQRQILLDRAQELETGILLLRRTAEDVAPSDVPNTEFDSPESSPDREALTLLASAATKQKEASIAVHENATDLATFREQWAGAVRASEWSLKRRETAEQYEALVARLRSEGVSDPGAYGSLVQKRRLLESQLADLGGDRGSAAGSRSGSRARSRRPGRTPPTVDGDANRFPYYGAWRQRLRPDRCRAFRRGCPLLRSALSGSV